MSNYMSDKSSECMEYMSKYTSWNVMAGITRSKEFRYVPFNIPWRVLNLKDEGCENEGSQIEFKGWVSKISCSMRSVVNM